MTPAVMQRMLANKFVPVTQFALVVLDECHHCNMGSDPINQLCQILTHVSRSQRPRILGLTACPVTTNKKNAADSMCELQMKMGATFFVPSADAAASLNQFVHKPVLYVHQFRCNQKIVEQFPVTFSDYRQAAEQGKTTFDSLKTSSFSRQTQHITTTQSGRDSYDACGAHLVHVRRARDSETQPV